MIPRQIQEQFFTSSKVKIWKYVQAWANAILAEIKIEQLGVGCTKTFGNVTEGVYMCSSLLQLAPGSRDLSQAEKIITIM